VPEWSFVLQDATPPRRVDGRQTRRSPGTSLPPQNGRPVWKHEGLYLNDERTAFARPLISRFAKVPACDRTSPAVRYQCPRLGEHCENLRKAR